MRLILPAAALGFQAACCVRCLLAAAAGQTIRLGIRRLLAGLGAVPEFKDLPLPWPVFWAMKTASTAPLLQTNLQTKTPTQNSQEEEEKKKKYSSLLEKQIMCCWKAMKSSCGYLMLLVYFRPLWVRSPIDVRGSLTCLTGWIEILEMLEEHLKSFTLFTKICVST